MSTRSAGRPIPKQSWYVWGYLLLGSLGAGFLLWEVVFRLLQNVSPLAALHNEVVLPFVLRAVYAETAITVACVLLAVAALFFWPHNLIARVSAVLVTLVFSYWLFHCSMWYYAYIPSMCVAVFLLYSITRYLWVVLFRASLWHAAAVSAVLAILLLFVADRLSGFLYWCAAVTVIPFAMPLIRAGSYRAVRRLVQSNNSRGVQLYYDAIRYFHLPPLSNKHAGLAGFWNRAVDSRMQGRSFWERLFVLFARGYRRRCGSGSTLDGVLLLPARLITGRLSPRRLQCTWLAELLKAQESHQLAWFYDEPSQAIARPDEHLQRMIEAAENHWEYHYFTPARLANNPPEICRLALKYERMSRIALAMRARLVNVQQDRKARVELGRALARQQQYLVKKAATLLDAASELSASSELVFKAAVANYLDITATNAESSGSGPPEAGSPGKSPDELRGALDKLARLRCENDCLAREIREACYWRLLAKAMDAGHMESILAALRELANQFSDFWGERDRFVHAFIYGHVCYRQRVGIRHTHDLRVALAGRSGDIFYHSDRSEIKSIILPEMSLPDDNHG
ncbi:MAG: hypothetical protein ACQESR_12750 [Planctomycetota bacterium]